MRSQEMTCSTKQKSGTQVDQGSARTSHNTGPVGMGSQYRITIWKRIGKLAPYPETSKFRGC